jgi:hypothetical protein
VVAHTASTAAGASAPPSLGGCTTAHYVGRGGALALVDSPAHVSRSLFRGNAASMGGGAIYAHGASARINISRSVFEANSAGAYWGGALLLGGGAVANIQESWFEDNRCAFGAPTVYRRGPRTGGCGASIFTLPYASVRSVIDSVFLSSSVAAASVAPPCASALWAPTSWAASQACTASCARGASLNITADRCDCESPTFGGLRCSRAITNAAGCEPACHSTGACAVNTTLHTNSSTNATFCQCSVGFGGSLCSEDINECASAPCQHGAMCHDSGANPAVAPGTFECACVEGFSGVRCEVLDLLPAVIGMREPIAGCTDSLASNYHATAVLDQGLCTYAEICGVARSRWGDQFAQCQAQLVNGVSSSDRGVWRLSGSAALAVIGHPLSGHMAMGQATPVVPAYNTPVDLQTVGAFVSLRYIRMRGQTRAEFEAEQLAAAPPPTPPSCRGANMICGWQTTESDCQMIQGCTWDLGTLPQVAAWLAGLTQAPAVRMGWDATLSIVCCIMESWVNGAIQLDRRASVLLMRSSVWHNAISVSCAAFVVCGGAALSAATGSQLRIVESVISSNRVEFRGSPSGAVTADGGAILAYGPDLNVTITSSTISQNVAVRHGGAIGLIGSGTLTLTDTLIESNVAHGQLSDRSTSIGYGDALELTTIFADVRSTLITPYDGTKTVHSTDTRPHGCFDTEDVPCPKNHGCSARSFSIFCTACTSNTVSLGRDVCRSCPVGLGPVETSQGRKCLPCLDGTISIGGVCVPCSAGTVPSVTRDTCVSCLPGRYSSNGTRCLSCQSGLVPTTDQSACESCTAGRANFNSSMQCRDCPAGLFAPSGSGVCAPCGPGKQSNADANACVKCPIGRAGANGTCSACEHGSAPSTYMGGTRCRRCADIGPGMVSEAGLCRACSPGTQPTSNRSSCVACEPGKVSPRGHACVECATGSIPDSLLPGAFSCTPCPPGTIVDANNRVHGNLRCSVCPMERVCPLMGTPAAVACGSGFSPDLTQQRCIPCSSGRAGEDGRCASICQYGEQPDTTRSFCVACPAGKFSLGDECKWCLLGWEVNAAKSGCAPCATGLYSNDGNGHGVQCRRCPARREPNRPVKATDCLLCPAGKFSADIAAWQSVDMIANPGLFVIPTQRCEFCPAGRFSGQGSIGCEVCPLGTTPTAGGDRCDVCTAGKAGLSLGLCTRCPSGYAPSQPTGASSCTLCRSLGPGSVVAPDGTRCISCKPKMQPRPHNAIINGTACMLCPVNTISPFGHNCTTCPAGLAPFNGISCELCSSGQYAVSESAQCHPCAVGMYSLVGAMKCLRCGDGEETIPGIPGSRGCQRCSGIRVGRNGTCSVECTAIQKPSSDRTSCIDCPRGTYFVRGACDSCKDGQEMRESNSVRTCVNCQAGYYNTIATPVDPCKRCTPGTESGQGSKACTLCTSGKYASADNRTCVVCPAGLVAPNEGSIRCTSCGAGLIAMPDRRSCGECPVGRVGTGGNCVSCGAGWVPNTYTGGRFCVRCLTFMEASVAVEGRCVLCPAGKQPSQDEVSCDACAAGTYSALGRACTPCTAGSVPSSRTQAFSCTPCSPGRFARAMTPECVWSNSCTSECSTCAVGLISGVGATECFGCGAGEEPIDAVRCQRCAEGQFSILGQRCHACGNHSADIDRISCSCHSGYTAATPTLANGDDCIDIDECLVDNGGCHPLSSHCINLPGSSSCGGCPVGFTGDGFDCIRNLVPWAGENTVSTPPAVEAGLEITASPSVLDEASEDRQQFVRDFVWDLSTFLMVPASSIEVLSIMPAARRLQRIQGSRMLMSAGGSAMSLRVTFSVSSGNHGPASAVLETLAAALANTTASTLFDGKVTRNLTPDQAFSYAMVCPPGHYRVKDELGQLLDRCDKCGPGTEPLANGCISCRANGKDLVSPSGLDCIPCSAGFQADAHSTYCESCFVAGPNYVIGSEMAAAGGRCWPCQSPYIPNVQRTACMCPPEYYDGTNAALTLDARIVSCVGRTQQVPRIQVSENSSCATCPSADDCVACTASNASMELHLKDGWWRPDPLSLVVYECAVKSRCAAGRCTGHHTGILCNACAAGYFQVRTCRECPHGAVSTLAAVVGGALFCGALLWIDRCLTSVVRLTHTPEHALGKQALQRHRLAAGRMMLEWSAVNSLATVIDVAWPNVWRVWGWFSGVIVDPVGAMASGACLLDLPSVEWAETRGEIAVIWPSVLVGTLIVRVIASLRSRHVILRTRRIDVAMASFVAFLVMVYPVTVYHVLSFVPCISEADDTHSQVLAHPGMPCPSRHSAMWFLGTFSVLLPTGLVLILRSKFRRYAGFVWYGCEPALFWWWELAVGTARKLAVASTAGLLGSRHPALALILAATSSLVTIAAQLHWRPYETTELHKLQLLCLASNAATCLAGVLYLTDTRNANLTASTDWLQIVVAMMVFALQGTVMLHGARQIGVPCRSRKSIETERVTPDPNGGKYSWSAMAATRREEKALDVQVAARITSTTRTVAELQTVVATLAEAAVHLPDRQQELAEIAAHVGRELRVAGRHMRIVQRIEGGFDLTPPQVEDGVDIDPELLHVKSGRIVGDGTMLHTGQSKSSRLRSLWARDDSTQKSVDVETAEKPALDTPPADDATKIALEPRKPAIRRTGTRASIFGEFVADGNTGGRASGGALDSLAVEANESTRIVEPVNETAKARALELKRRNAALRRAAAIARVTATAQARTRRLNLHKRPTNDGRVRPTV